MIDALQSRPIWLYKPVIDFRKQMSGLVSVVESEMKMHPNNGAIYLFRNRHKDKLKLLVWDRNGFILGYKRLEKGRFDVGVDVDGSLKISPEQFKMLLSGMPILWLEKEIVFS